VVSPARRSPCGAGRGGDADLDDPVASEYSPYGPHELTLRRWHPFHDPPRRDRSGLGPCPLFDLAGCEAVADTWQGPPSRTFRSALALMRARSPSSHFGHSTPMCAP